MHQIKRQEAGICRSCKDPAEWPVKNPVWCELHYALHCVRSKKMGRARIGAVNKYQTRQMLDVAKILAKQDPLP
jgi:hypothetical protein